MSILLKNVRVLDHLSPAHNKQVDLLIDNGRIISFNGGSAEKTLDLKGKVISVGWMDLSADFCDPGYEHREDILSGSELASKGGFTHVCPIPGTHPPITSKSDVSYLIKKAPPYLRIHPVASVSELLEGKHLTEMLDLYEAGSCAFSDGDNPIWNTELLLKALQYTSTIGAPIIQNAREHSLSFNTHMHEGTTSTMLGLRGEPSLAEELAIQRDIEVLRYAGGHLHFSKVSTSKGVDLIRKAKSEGLHVTCDVGLHHLLFSDNCIGDFDTNYKSLPPYRSEDDRMALIDGLRDDTIDAICSNHRPIDQEGKHLEFDLAEPGNISLQTFYSSICQISQWIEMEVLIRKITEGPRCVTGIEPAKIDIGEMADLTIMDPEASWVLNDSTNLSKSKNSPFWGQKLKGKVIGTILESHTMIDPSW